MVTGMVEIILMCFLEPWLMLRIQQNHPKNNCLKAININSKIGAHQAAAEAYIEHQNQSLSNNLEAYNIKRKRKKDGHVEVTLVEIWTTLGS